MESAEAPSFPFDFVFVFDPSVRGGHEFADNFYADLIADGLVACKYTKAFSHKVKRVFVGVGASDRFLHGVVEHFHFTEERTEVRKHDGITRIYAQNTRQRIILRFIRLRRYGGPHASLHWLQDSGILVDYFPLHDPKEVVDLRRGFLRFIFLPRQVFLADVEEYFGEELAMYIHWLRMLIIFSAPLCVVFAVFFAFEIHDGYSSWSMAAAGLIAPVAAQLFHEFWKRKERNLAFEFGTLDLDEVSEVRPDFKGTQRLVQWRREVKIRHEGEANDTVIVTAGNFELPIQHTFPRAATADQPRQPSIDPFKTEVLQQLNFDVLPAAVMERHYPERKRMISYLFTIPTSLVFCVTVVVAIYAIDFIREVFTTDSGVLPTEYSVAVSVINGVVIVGLNTIYPMVVHKLVEWENHRTQDAFEASYIVKLFAFVFVNSYFPVFLQLFKLYVVNMGKLDSVAKSERVQAVVIQIFSACVSTVFVSNIKDLILPFVMGPIMEKVGILLTAWRSRNESTEPIEVELEDSVDQLSPTSASPTSNGTVGFFSRFFASVESPRHVFEHQMRLSGPQPVAARFMGRIILFGFAVIFATVFPLGFAFVLVDAIITPRVEIIRYLYFMRRMVSRQVNSIGGWKECIQLIIFVGAVTNCLTITLESDSLVKWYGATDSWESRLTIFIALEHILLFLVWGVEYVIPDVSTDIQRIKALQSYIARLGENRVSYEPDDLHMPAHTLLLENILPETAQSNGRNKACVQCASVLVEGDRVRKFACHHHVHEDCVAAFLESQSIPNNSSAPASPTSGFASCPVCGADVDTRYFFKSTNFHEYVRVRKSMMEELVADTNVRQDRQEMQATAAAENAQLQRIAGLFAIPSRAFPVAQN